MNSDDDYEPDDDLYDEDEDEDFDEDLDDEEDENDWDFEDEDEEDDDDIEECEYTNTGSCDDCTLPEDKECPYSPEDDDI